MKILFSAAAALAMAATAGAVQAQEASWTGPYLSAYAAGSKHAKNKNETVVFDTNLDGVYGDTVRTSGGANAFSPGFCDGNSVASTPGACAKDGTGFEFGARAGYDVQFGSFLVGALVEVSRLDVDDNVTAFSTTPASYVLKRKLEYQGALRGRAGFVAADKTLIYGTGGVSRGRIQHGFFSTNSTNSFPRAAKHWQNGWQAGGGIEHRFFPNLTMGVEYIYTRYKDDDGFAVRATGPAPATNPFLLVNPAGTDFARSQDKLKVHSLRLTTAYRF